jgi:hypothetical protein
VLCHRRKNKNYKPSLRSEEGTRGGRGRLTSLPLSVRLYFQIGLHRKDEYILRLIQSVLGVGGGGGRSARGAALLGRDE